MNFILIFVAKRKWFCLKFCDQRKCWKRSLDSGFQRFQGHSWGFLILIMFANSRIHDSESNFFWRIWMKFSWNFFTGFADFRNFQRGYITKKQDSMRMVGRMNENGEDDFDFGYTTISERREHEDLWETISFLILIFCSEGRSQKNRRSSNKTLRRCFKYEVLLKPCCIQRFRENLVLLGRESFHKVQHPFAGGPQENKQTYT